ncbi:ParB/RepB/Spo0J family partition protein [Bifidobacterium olomucense]|uniref:Chromosome partitioning protein ParB n=1 Tax=Bifidobacterium olomucense TaxID=2675324 RepID=A0A7Y0HXE9_9BIFI|nr:ParB/RepB/Spo0J family partition protein [Bifidobacterium sp. DSM 109959]NMM99316.1 chromosome partitioning protein ParB [Bifidobacterium sp. DSM 109959]
MASKSRLGKGLGALFPTLPGEESAKSSQLELLPDAEKTEPVVYASAKSASKTADKSDKKSAAKRAAMPSIGSIAHPSDLFFGGDVTTSAQPASSSPSSAILADAVSPKTNKEAVSPQRDRSDVSRETSDVASTADSKTVEAKNKGTQAKNDKDKDAQPELKPVEGGYLAELKLAEIGPNAHQPRTIFDEDELNELSASIKEVGVLQPIVVRRRPADQIAAAKKSGETEESSANPFAGRMDSPYELIMGERRWRASQLAGLETIPAIVKTTADDDMLRDALLENLHRVALNPLEEAAAYQQMIEEFGLTQAQLSKSVSKSRPQIANTLRLLNLPAAVQKKVAAGVLSSGHARALLGLSDPEEMDKLASRIIAEGLSVRSTEEIVSMKIASGEQPKKPKTSKTNPWLGSAIQQSLENHFDTKVSIKGTKKHGRIEIVFSSPEDMDRILQLLVPSQNDEAGKDSHWV